MVEHFFLKYGDVIKAWIYRLIIVINLTIVLSMIITNYTTGKATIFGYRPFFIMSESMEPTIMTHQVVLAVPIEPEDVEVGDIVTYNLYSNVSESIKQTIIHRVVAIQEDGTFIFKGDNNEKLDNPVDASRIGYKIIWY
jgi:signal peptidase I